MHFIGQMRGLGMTIAEIRELTTGWPDRTDRSSGTRLAELLRRSRRRLEQRIAAQQQILRRIDAFEAEHRTDLARGDVCWAGDPRCAAGLDPHPGVSS
ncbi:DNA-binding transcriptional MerR regulator [Kribbella aluminosa]|uniref:DNA-binding transcriptional MerR regulator n=1 Tax=Kribbella aluminosa TaxID=416017 RepID=A0ABS4UBD9_9ACTN|nr:MerR family DNA-binding protein [Kribbella aluminosa]MBP2348958.1 DNA-binding transcriptional MerR regulator [Kribbella aluminosa]